MCQIVQRKYTIITINKNLCVWSSFFVIFFVFLVSGNSYSETKLATACQNLTKNDSQKMKDCLLGIDNKDKSVSARFDNQQNNDSNIGSAFSVIFPFDSSQLSTDAQEILIQIGLVLKDVDGNFLIEGHTDNKGDDGYNLLLSARRANIVKTFLILQGIAESRIYTLGFGKSRPVDTNDLSSELNRRVVVGRLSNN